MGEFTLSAWSDYYDGVISADDLIRELLANFNGDGSVSKSAFVTDCKLFTRLLASGGFMVDDRWKLNYSLAVANGSFDKFLRPLADSEDLFRAFINYSGSGMPWWVSMFGTFQDECIDLIVDNNDLTSLYWWLNAYSSKDTPVRDNRCFRICGFSEKLYHYIMQINYLDSAISDFNISHDDVMLSILLGWFVCMRGDWHRMVELRVQIIARGLFDDFKDYYSDDFVANGKGGDERLAIIEDGFFDGLPPEYMLGVMI